MRWTLVDLEQMSLRQLPVRLPVGGGVIKLAPIGPDVLTFGRPADLPQRDPVIVDTDG